MRPPTFSARCLVCVALVSIVTSTWSASGSASVAATADDTLAGAIMAEIDAVRADRGLDELRRSARLTRLARDVAADMGRNGSFSHPSNANGEALFWSSGPVSASEVVQSFLDSPLHRRITLSGQWRTIGVAAVLVQNAPGAFGGLDATIVVVEYGPSPS